MTPGDAPRADAENPAVATDPPAADSQVRVSQPAAEGPPVGVGQAVAEERSSRRPPPWLGRTLWALAVVAILGPFIVFPVTLGAGDDAGDEVRLAAILGSFNRTLAATGWGDLMRVLVWLSAGLALVAAFALLWVAFADEG